MMHDVISDILASPEVSREGKRAEIRRHVDLFRDSTSYATTVEEWRQMAVGMGVHNQGGPAVGYMAELPRATVPRGMSMAGMDHSQMDHAAHATPDDDADHADHADHAAQPEHDAHAGHAMPGMRPEMHRAMEFVVRLLADPQVEARIHADPRLHEIWSRPAVQEHLRMIREMHGGGREQPQHRH
jgi:hypothetical protein